MLPRPPGFSLAGTRALVTGAGRGIGAGLAVALAEAGAAVTLLARSADELDRMAEALRAAGAEASTLPLDLSCISAIAPAITRAGPFDILVNNAGCNRPLPIAAVTEADYDAVLGLNLKSAYFVARAVALGMVEAGRGGSLIHVGSQMGHVGAADRSLYCAAKSGLEGMSRALAVELGAHRIRSNVIAPTFIETAMTRPFLEVPGFREAVLGKITLGRLGLVEDLMGAVVFLASAASAMVTGTSLRIDGGWTAE